MYAKNERIYFILQNNSKSEKKNILLMIPSSEGCYCIAVSNFPVLLRGVTPKIMVAFIA